MTTLVDGSYMLSPITSLGASILRLLPPERAHKLGLTLLPQAKRLGVLPGEARGRGVTWQGLCFPNRVGLAAGYDKNGEAIDALAACGFGFVELGTVTPQPQPGNPPPRLFRLRREQAIINRMGFNNKGIDYLVERLQQTQSRVIKGVNIGKNAATPLRQAPEDYRYCMQKVYPWCDYLVANISSPNTRELRNLQLGEERNRLFRELASSRARLAEQQGRRVPILIKIAPDLSKEDAELLVASLLAYDLDGIIATNTTIQRPPSIRHACHAGQQGGLSGRPLKPIALGCLREIAKHLPDDKMLIGVGGITSREDAKEFFAAGAKLVQLYSAMVYRGLACVDDLVQL